MVETSAGLLVWRRGRLGPEFLLAHPGGPFWARRDAGAWSLPKGLIAKGEAPLSAARREFREETGLDVEGAFAPLTPLRQPSRKMVWAWAVEADLDLAGFASNLFEMEWPPHSGRRVSFPEIDRIAYFDVATAAEKLLPGQRPFLAEALRLVGSDPGP